MPYPYHLKQSGPFIIKWLNGYFLEWRADRKPYFTSDASIAKRFNSEVEAQETIRKIRWLYSHFDKKQFVIVDEAETKGENHET